MTVKVNSEGDFVENAVSNADSPNNAHVVSDLYDVLSKGKYDEREFSIVTLAHEVRKAFEVPSDGDSDIARWCHIADQHGSPERLFLTEKTSDMKSDPNLGRLFYKSVGYTANDYQTFEDKFTSDADIRPLGDVNEEGEVLKNHLIESGIVESEETVHVPVNSEGELIPPAVMSADRQQEAKEAGELNFDLPTYEEGIERLETLLSDHFGETIETEENNPSENDSEQPERQFGLADPTNIDGVGDSTVNKLTENGFKVVPTAEVMERADMPDDASDASNFFAGDVTTIEGGIPQMEYDEGELLARLNEIDGEVNDRIFDRVFDAIDAGNYETAESFIGKYE